MSSVHPARAMVESLHAEGAVARLQVDMQHEDVVIPDFVREQWPERLVIDLDPSWPLNLAFTDSAVEADLSFGGVVERCVFPLAAIYFVVDRETGKGIRLEGASPEARDRERDFEEAARRVARRAQEGAETVGPRRRRRRRSEDPGEPEMAPAGEGPPATDEPAAADDAAESTEERAQRRRAVFRVIDGDG